MKRFFLLLCIFCGLYTFSAFITCGLFQAHGFGESTEGELAPVTFSHSTDCDSARVYFGYPSSNLYLSIKLFPLVGDSSQLFRDSLDLDSIGGHYGEVRYYERDAGGVSGYAIGEWLHIDPTPGDTIQRDASTSGDQMDLTGGAETKVRNQCADANSDSGWTATRAGRIDDFVYFWGACDECYFRAYPEGGQANKDSLIIIDPSLGADSLVAKIIYKHGTVSAVCDTAYFYKSPWW